MNDTPALEQARDWLLFKDVLRAIDTWGTERWLTVYDRKESRLDSQLVFCAVIPDALVADALRSSDWDLSVGDGAPGCTVSIDPDGQTVTYYRLGSADGVEPLVLCRRFCGLRPSALEISEEYRLFHELYYDEDRHVYVKLAMDGEEEDAIRVSEDHLDISIRHVKQFLSVKGARLAVFISARRFSEFDLEELGIAESRNEFRSSDRTHVVNVGEYDHTDPKTFSWLLGKKLIEGMPRSKSGYWPYDEEVTEYARFVIGYDAEGRPALHSCDHRSLSNYFGANPGEPHYLTPVFFRREVLQKYYASPAKYTVEDNAIYCRSLWSLRVDNNHEKYVVVYLGDLGRDLSCREQSYWKSFNVPPDGSISEVEFRRAFLGEFTDPSRADLVFKLKFDLFNRDWLDRFGWELIRPLIEKDRHFLAALRIPLTTDQAEFDSQVLALAKVVVDSLNDSALESEPPAKTPGAKSIDKLKAFLQAKGLVGFEHHIQFLRDLFALRSTGSAHRKGRSYEKAGGPFGIASKPLPEAFEDILLQAIALLDYLRENLLT